VRLIVFDVDGTLIDSQHLIVEAMSAAFIANGLPAPSGLSVLRHVGLSVAEAMRGIDESLDETMVGKLVAAYRAAFAERRQKSSFSEPFYPGARETLEALAADGDTLLGIAMGKSRRGVDHLLARENLGPLFATIQTADDAPSKPHPGMLLRAMSETGALPADTVVVGDSSYDMLMARSAGVSAIGVAWGYHSADELLEAGASAVARDFAQLLTLLTERKTVVAA
jgi:phosphoglycolate phosphatase